MSESPDNIDKQHSINFESNAAIIPFAQSEEVSHFIEGIHPDTKQLIYALLRKWLLEEYPSMMSDAVQEKKFQEKVTEMGKQKFNEYWKHIEEYTSKNYVQPTLDAIAILPKDELAAMAEALVNITTLKRRVSMEPETVGGPIDVAVISKKDGFIWIKRKHYFKPEYNYEFFSNSQTRRLANNESDE